MMLEDPHSAEILLRSHWDPHSVQGPNPKQCGMKTTFVPFSVYLPAVSCSDFSFLKAECGVLAWVDHSGEVESMSGHTMKGFTGFSWAELSTSTWWEAASTLRRCNLMRKYRYTAHSLQLKWLTGSEFTPVLKGLSIWAWAGMGMGTSANKTADQDALGHEDSTMHDENAPRKSRVK